MLSFFTSSNLRVHLIRLFPEYVYFCLLFTPIFAFLLSVPMSENLQIKTKRCNFIFNSFISSDWSSMECLTSKKMVCVFFNIKKIKIKNV